MSGECGETSVKSIGILGGFGPQATMDLVRRIHVVSQRLIPQDWNRGYPPLVVHYLRVPPVATTDGGPPLLPLRASPELLAAAARAGAHADFLLVAGNAPHLFQGEIEKAAGRPILSMIEVALAEVGRRGWRTVGVLGFGSAAVPVYTDRMRAAGMRCQVIDEALQRRINAAVVRVQEGRETEESRETVREAVALLRGRGVDGTILGCTELGPLLDSDAEAEDLVDPVPLLAEAAVRRAME